MLITLGQQTCEFTPWRPELGQVFDQPFAFDTETTPIDRQQPELIPIYVLGAACDGARGYFVPPQHVAEFFQSIHKARGRCRRVPHPLSHFCHRDGFAELIEDAEQKILGKGYLAACQFL